MATPAQVDVWGGLDAGQGEHLADVLDQDGERLFARAVANDQPDLEALLERAARHRTPGLVTAFYDRKRAEGKRRDAALICLARRCDVILAMLRTGQPYQPARPAPSLPQAA